MYYYYYYYYNKPSSAQNVGRRCDACCSEIGVMNSLGIILLKSVSATSTSANELVRNNTAKIGVSHFE